MACYQQTELHSDKMNESIKQYILVVVYHQEYDSDKWLSIVMIAANDRAQNTTECILCIVVHGVDPQMTLQNYPEECHHQHQVEPK